MEANGQMYQILVAEDNTADVYLIREALREHNVECELRIASDGAAVLQFIGTDRVAGNPRQLDLIILDLNLPRHDGTEILQCLRDSDEFANVPVAVLTSSDSPRDRAVASQFGAACYLRKPSNLEQFLNLGAVFKDLLQKKTANAARA